MERQPALAQGRLHPVGLRAGGVQPEDDTAAALPVMARVALDERRIVVRHAEVPGVEQDDLAAQRLRQFERLGLRSDLDRSLVSAKRDPVFWNTDFQQTPLLVFAEHLELVDPATKKKRPVKEKLQPERPLAELGDEALGMKVGDAVGELLAQQEVRRHDPVQEERRATGEQDLVGGLGVFPRATQQSSVRCGSPERTLAEMGAFVRPGQHAHRSQRPLTGLLVFGLVGRRGESDQRNVGAFGGETAGFDLGVLADRAEVGRQPVADRDQALQRAVGAGAGPGARTPRTPPFASSSTNQR